MGPRYAVILLTLVLAGPAAAVTQEELQVTFVVNDFDYLLSESRSSDIRQFHEDLLARCELAQFFEAQKPLFLEFDLTVFDCSAL